jgi:hypothetical protein
MTAGDEFRNKPGRESQGARRQDELIGYKPTVVKWLLTLIREIQMGPRLVRDSS